MRRRRPGSVADGVLGLWRQEAKSVVVAYWAEDGIVAEASSALFFQGDDAFAGSVEGMFVSVRTKED